MRDDPAAVTRASSTGDGRPALERAIAETRPQLLGLAYRMLGSMSDAEDVVQETALRALWSAPADLRNPAAYLTTITTRLAIDHLRSARVRRERYVGPWLPEPVATDPASDASGPAVLAESLAVAFLAVLESLSPDERATLLLHDVFGYRHAEVAEVLGGSEVASRQLLRRARRRLADDRPRTAVDRSRLAPLVERFVGACRGGDMDAFVRLLADDAVMVSDGGAAVKAARHPLRGRVRIARFLSAVMTKVRAGSTFEAVIVNGQPGMAVRHGDRLTDVVAVEADADGDIVRLDWIRNPDKLRRFADVTRERRGTPPP